MWINPVTQQTYALHSDIRSAFPQVSLPSDVTDDLIAELGIAPLTATAQPTYDPITQRCYRDGCEKIGDVWQYKWTIEVLDTATIATNQAAKITADAALVADKVDALWRAADTYTSGYISGVAIGLLTIGVLQSLPKALAVSAWSSAVWDDYYARKALVTASSVANLDFSSHGPMPYSVPELRAELGM